MAAARSPPNGPSVQCDAWRPFSGAAGAPPAAWLRPVELQISEGGAGMTGFALASSGQPALSAMLARASMAAVRRRRRGSVTEVLLAQKRAVFHFRNAAPVLVFSPDMQGRLEDRRLLTGQGKFTSDWNFPSQAFAAFLRSDRAHAEIVSIDVSAALAAPGVLALLTGKDVAEAGYRSIPTNLGVKDRHGEPLKKPPRPVLAQGKVRHVGECVACVIAESAHAAQDAAELIAVEYNELPAVTVAEKALAPGAPLLHAELPGNLSFDWVAGDESATDAAFRAASKAVKIALENPRMVGNPMEPRACLATYDAASQKYALYACTQGTAGMRGQLVYTM